jgi:hypothetical protein
MAGLPRVLVICPGPRLAQLRGFSLIPRSCPMATTILSAGLVPATPVFANTGRLALAGFLAGYSGLICQVHELDLRHFAGRVPGDAWQLAFAGVSPAGSPPRRAARSLEKMRVRVAGVGGW